MLHFVFGELQDNVVHFISPIQKPPGILNIRKRESDGFYSATWSSSYL
ncbi:hypothetical protein [Piscinibacter sakaiensis]